MKLEVLPEPDLQFGAGNCPDIRFGLRDFGPVVLDSAGAPRLIKVGFVGTLETIQKVRQWMANAKTGVAEKPSKKPKFRPAFPGFGPNSPFRCDWTSEPRLERSLSAGDLNAVLGIPEQPKAAQKAAALFIQECAYLNENAKVDVIICAPPLQLLRHLDEEEDEHGEAEEGESAGSVHARPARDRVDFHDLLKAQSLFLNSPIQVIRPATYDDTVRHVSGRGRHLSLQDPATRAWNFHTALYYKAGGTPWRLLRRSTDFETCFIGVSFYFTPNRQEAHTSVAQVFNERGEGTILRGSEARKSKEDRQPHLTRPAMKRLLLEALRHFKREHDFLPARVVLHKTSSFSAAEQEGCEDAFGDAKIVHRDLLVVRESNIRLFRFGAYPPLRGTCLELDARHLALCTRGSVPFFEMYPGMYVPRAIEIELVLTEQAPATLAQEILALTKMNWNNTQFDSALPITVRAARQVGSILKHVGSRPGIQTRYAFYM